MLTKVTHYTVATIDIESIHRKSGIIKFNDCCVIRNLGPSLQLEIWSGVTLSLWSGMVSQVS